MHQTAAVQGSGSPLQIVDVPCPECGGQHGEVLWVGHEHEYNDTTNAFKAYRRNEIREYLIWRVAEKTFDWYVLRDSKYEALLPSTEGYLKSESFPGLWLDPAALIRGDKARVYEVLQHGLRSPEHAAFVARLQAAGA